MQSLKSIRPPKSIIFSNKVLNKKNWFHCSCAARQRFGLLAMHASNALADTTQPDLCVISRGPLDPPQFIAKYPQGKGNNAFEMCTYDTQMHCSHRHAKLNLLTWICYEGALTDFVYTSPSWWPMHLYIFLFRCLFPNTELLQRERLHLEVNLALA